MREEERLMHIVREGHPDGRSYHMRKDVLMPWRWQARRLWRPPLILLLQRRIYVTFPGLYVVPTGDKDGHKAESMADETTVKPQES
jgi:hypothetical protein